MPLITSRTPARRFAATAGAIIAVAALTGCSQVSSVMEQILPEHNDVHTLVVGDCFDNPVNLLTTDDTLVDIPRENCTLDHDNEVIASVELDGGTFPGDEAVAAQGADVCKSRFEDFIGVASDEAGTLGFDSFVPSAESWKLGDREILCFVFDSAGQTAYSLEGKGAERLTDDPEPDAEATTEGES